MKYEYYKDVIISDGFSVFEFISSGKHGDIKKRISFVKTESPDVYNLAFGNLGKNDELDDMTVSNNGDRDKILATIWRAVNLYTLLYPQRWIYIIGNTDGKMRLYRMAISLNFEEITDKFEIYSVVPEEQEAVPFQKNITAEAFFIRRKLFGVKEF